MSQQQEYDRISQWLVQRVAKLTKLPSHQITVEKPFPDFGLDSRQAVGLSGDLEEWLGRELEPTLVWDYPTIEVMARHLAFGETQGQHAPDGNAADAALETDRGLGQPAT